MIKLGRIGHVLMRVADEKKSKEFYRDMLGFTVSEEDPEHGGTFMTLGDNYHTFDLDGHPHPESAVRPVPGQLGLMHIAFQVDSYEALRDAYLHLSSRGVSFRGATNHVNQRSLYFYDPDGNTLEIYFELPHARELFAAGRPDIDEHLPVTKPGEPPPAWLYEDWPGPEMKARIAAIRDGKAKAAE